MGFSARNRFLNASCSGKGRIALWSKKVWLLTVVALLVLFVSGCMVTESTYLKKVDEADDLEQGLAT